MVAFQTLRSLPDFENVANPTSSARMITQAMASHLDQTEETQGTLKS